MDHIATWQDGTWQAQIPFKGRNIRKVISNSTEFEIQMEWQHGVK